VDEERAIPLISLHGNLIVSVQFELSDRVMERLIQDVTRRIEETQVAGLIMDFSGAELLDSHVTRRLRDLAVTARVMGVRTVVCGLRRAVVITLVEMGLSLSGVPTALNLERALEVLARKPDAPRDSLSASPVKSSAAEQASPEADREAAGVVVQ
jgi:rsbT antagonist protein RsbS